MVSNAKIYPYIIFKQVNTFLQEMQPAYSKPYQ